MPRGRTNRSETGGVTLLTVTYELDQERENDKRQYRRDLMKLLRGRNQDGLALEAEPREQLSR